MLVQNKIDLGEFKACGIGLEVKVALRLQLDREVFRFLAGLLGQAYVRDDAFRLRC